MFWPAPIPPPLLPHPGDFNAASEEMDTSFLSYDKFTFCRDQAAQLLVERAEKFWPAPIPPPLLPHPGDFNAASEEMDKSFLSLRSLLDEVSS
jgi:hypothetical protein